MDLQDKMLFQVEGHLRITDDLGNTIIDKKNAIHPQNIARVIARGLANEPNNSIYRIAFGNGGTFIDASYQIFYNAVNDGQPPDSTTWDSRLYNETYSEIVDDGHPTLNPLLGTDPGSADSSGVRPGGGAVPSNDPPSIVHVSGPGVRSSELGLTSLVSVYCTLNASEPTGQFDTDNVSPTEDPNSSFAFDEIALFTKGGPAVSSIGYHDVDVNSPDITDDTTLLPTTTYDFFIQVDGGTNTQITFTTPASGSGIGGEILYGDLIKAILTGDLAWGFGGVNPLPGGAIVNLTNDGTFSGVPSAQTYGFLRFQSITPGSTSSVILSAGTTNDMIIALNSPLGGSLETPVSGKNAGIQNDPTNEINERERLLTHIIFSPVLKPANRTFNIIYELVIAVARTEA